VNNVVKVNYFQEWVSRLQWVDFFKIDG